MEVMVFQSVVFLCLLFYTFTFVDKDRLCTHPQETIKLSDKHLLMLILAAGLFIRLGFGVQQNVKSGDLTNLRWAVNTLMDNGYKSVYESGVNILFPPLLVQILGVIGAICKIFGFSSETIGSTAAIIVFKLPCIICELVMACFVFKAARKNFTKRATAIITAVFLLNPVFIMSSCSWGYMNSVVSLCVLLMCWFLYQKKSGFAVIAFTAALLMDPLMIMMVPVLVIGVVDDLVLDGIEVKKIGKFLICLAGSVAGAVLVCLPMGISTVLSNTKDYFAGYQYCTINAYNFWTMTGHNWGSEATTYLGLPSRTFAGIVIALLGVAAIIWYYAGKRKKENYFCLAAFTVMIGFSFATRMHERDLYQVMAVLIMFYALKPCVENYVFYAVFTMIQFANVWFVCYKYDSTKFNVNEPVPNLISKLLLISLAAFIGGMVYRLKHGESVESAPEKEEIKTEEERTFVIERTSKMPKWTKFDTIALLVIMIVYSAFALRDIGYRYAPHTQWSYNTGTEDTNNEIVLDLGESKFVQNIKYYLGNFENRHFTIQYSENADGPWTDAGDSEWVSVFCWGEHALNTQTRYVKLTCTSDKAVVFELAITDENNKPIQPANASDYQTLFDEQKMVPERSTFRDSTYFDEIYHARTAYEFIHGLLTYESTHPPLGKIIMSIGVKLFGMNPFGWRIMGILFGIAMIPVFYGLSRRIFKESWIAAVSTILFSFDFMHFAQTRIATIDVFVTFFIICSYYFMYRYYKTSFYDTSLKQTFVILGCCGFLMGCQMAAKWTGVYAAVGLAVIFFITIGKRFNEYLYAKKDIHGTTNGISHEYIVKNFVGFTWKTIGFCCVVFIVIPAIIYTLSYIPFIDGEGTKNLVMRMIKNQTWMLEYHKGVHQEHPFSSRWWQWPIMYRPIWYFSGHVNDTLSEGISAFGNPAVWWAGIPAFFYLIRRIFQKKDKKALFMVIGYLSQYLPWVFVGRTTFIYHYFTSVPFVVLMVAYCLYLLVKEAKVPKPVVFTYVAVAVILFVMFYPVLAGQPVKKEFVFHVLRWMKSWVLVS